LKVGGVLGAASPFLGDAQARDYQKQQNKIAQQNAQGLAAIQKEQNRLTLLQQETDRKAALKRAVARQRVNYGASGVGSGDGSAEAVLLGLFNESDEERKIREQLSALKDSAIDLNLDNAQQKNLLEEARTAQKQTLSRLTDIF
jgi:hypothetical protein